MRTTLTTLITCSVITAAASVASAQTPSLGFGDGIAFTSEHQYNETTGRYEINSPAGGFNFDPDAGAWEKLLFAPSNGFMPGEIYCVTEAVTFFPSPTGAPDFPLADWHETIELGFDGQIWDVWNLDLGDPVISTNPGGAPLDGLSFMLNMDRTELWFDFDPIEIGPNGVTLYIDKYFQYTGETLGFDPVVITQYPTPTPGTFTLLGLAGIVGARRRR